MSTGGTVRRSGSKGSLSMTNSARAVLIALALSSGAIVPAYGQTPPPTTEPAQTTTPTETTPTQTTPTQTTPTETTPTETAPPAESPGPSSAPNEYVESVPTGGGQSPATGGESSAAPAPATSAPTSATPKTEPGGDAVRPAKTQRRKHRRAHTTRQRERHHAAAPAAAPPVPTAPAATTAAAGEPADPLLLGLALLAITVGVFGTAVARRQGAGA
jgi:cytoskeletal protein RodZ